YLAGTDSRRGLAIALWRLGGTEEAWGRHGELIVNHVTGVWITGVGAATPLGHDYASIADNLLAGRSGVAAITGFDTSDHPSQIGGQVSTVPCPRGCAVEDFARR